MASLLFSLSAIFISILSHTLFISHEKHRRQSANIFAEESEELNKRLRSSQVVLEDISAKMSSISDALRCQTEEHAAQLVALDSGTKKIQRNTEVLSQVVSEGQVSSRLLLEKENALHEKINATSRDVTQYAEALAYSTAAVSDIGKTADQFSEVVRDSQGIKEQLRQATNRFALFSAGLGWVAQSGHPIEQDEIMVSIPEETAAPKKEAAALQSRVSVLSAQNAAFDAIRVQWGIF